MNGSQARMARALVKLGVREIASAAGVTPNTISRIENGSDAKQSTINAVQTVYEDMGVKFLAAGDVTTSASICMEEQLK
ncbi:helix-turn-helix transcriptional regulator [Sulfitobacter sp. W074]|uniref:helix-turn-helix domain-containing protein n=1 Tax=Sulfitobacter sp. W074 TaxID=2867026 RepID=UPI0021A920A1|nr:helix-turn-helix transcriptional regulator [Sulfitobacter sp. W074]